MSIRRAVTAGLGTLALAVTAALFPVTPAAAAPGDCYAWRTLQFGDTGLHAVVEPGAPWHVRLGTAANGYQNFQFCDVTPATGGTTRIIIDSNANGYLKVPADPNTGHLTRRVTADGDRRGYDYWFVCALDAKWVEIRFTASSHYLGRNSSNYLVVNDDYPNGNTLWRRSQFSNFVLSAC